MILGKIFGKITTTNFSFLVEGKAKKFQYCQVYHPDYEYVLCQITEIERNEKTIAKCVTLGYKNHEGKIRQIRTPFDIGQEVLIAEDRFISEIIQLSDEKNCAYIGNIEGRDIKVNLDLNKLLTKHIVVLAKTGSGKSYAAGVLVEEIIGKKIPILIIDPHGEYHQIRYPNDSDKDKMKRFSISPKGYSQNVVEFGDPSLKQEIKPLRLNENLSNHELMHIIPTKLSPAQMNVLYSAIKNIDKLSFDSLLYHLEKEENYAKFSVINIIDYLQTLGIFSQNPTPYNELISPGRCSIINLKGIEPEIQQVFVYKILSDLFQQRKKEKIPPFFVVVEEAHSFCPERSFGESKSSKILRTLASEGRKFGLGLCIISQRPARIDKSVLSQCSTQIILKVTNPNDLRAISNSVEGITSESEKEIINLPIGTAMVTGIVDVPLFVNIRPRKTRHGGNAIDMFSDIGKKESFMEKKEEFGEKEILPVIKPKISKKDLILMSDKPIRKILTNLIPAVMFLSRNKKEEFSLLFELVKGCLVFNDIHYKLPELDSFSKDELLFIKELFKRKHALPNDIKDKKILKGLQDRNYVVFENSVYFLNPEYIFTDLSNKKSFKKIRFNAVEYDKKIKSVILKEDLQKILKNYVDIRDSQDCFITKYDIFYE